MKIDILLFLVAVWTAAPIQAAKLIPDFSAADLVLGQIDFIGIYPGIQTNGSSMKLPTGVVVDPVSRKVFVSDFGRHRILRFPSVENLVNGAKADAVLGQVDLDSRLQVTSEAGLNFPASIFLDRHGRLWVADSNNNRVLMYESAVTRESGASADRVYGQPGFSTSAVGTTDSSMNNPTGVFVDSKDRLWVSDYGNHRVLRFDSITTTPSGAAANGLLGQSDFTSNGKGAGPSKFQGPSGVVVSSTGTLFVADKENNRVLRFTGAASLPNGAAADAVLGQPDFDTTSPGVSSVKFHAPSGACITMDGDMWVCEAFNNRLLRFDNVSSKGSGAPADGVIGQPGFTTPSMGGYLHGLTGPYFNPFVDYVGNLWVGDTYNNRVLRFPPDQIKPTINLAGNVPKTTTNKTITFSGRAADNHEVSLVRYRIGNGPLKKASGTTSWKFKQKLAIGGNTITVFAIDRAGNPSLTKVIKVTRRRLKG